MPDALISSALARFADAYGYRPTFAASAPGRVNLMGDHTDYAGGLAMPCAIDRHTVAVAALREGVTSDSRVVSTVPGSEALRLPARIEDRPRGDWGDYLRGVRRGFAELGHSVPAMDIVIAGDLPVGAGLSSSASLELCYASLLERALGLALNPQARALLCQRAEHEFAGVPCGVLDQFAVTYGNEGCAMVLDCRDLEVAATPLGDGVEILVLDSAVSHALADGEYARRREAVAAAETALGLSLRDATTGDLDAVADPLLKRRARHVISENQRVRDFAAALASSEWGRAGAIMRASHASLRDDFEVSCPELDWLVDAAVTAGVHGARMTGGGFGGSVVCLVSPDAAREVEARVVAGYAQTFARACTPLRVKPVGGARAWTLESAP